MSPFPVPVPIPMSPLMVAERFLDLEEVPGPQHNQLIAGMIALVRAEMNGQGVKMVGRTPSDDETAWCSAFMGFVAFVLKLERPSTHLADSVRRYALRARSWLSIGHPINLHEATPGWDCVIFNREEGPMDPAIINAAGHVGLFLGLNGQHVMVRGGNQGNRVSDRPYAVAEVLGVRRWRM